jgi:hypothetical protein
MKVWAWPWIGIYRFGAFIGIRGRGRRRLGRERGVLRLSEIDTFVEIQMN